jgi:PPK2 family polyphosphate:nucleotide phosphotransferase
MNIKKYRVSGNDDINLSDISTTAKKQRDKDDIEKKRSEYVEKISDLQYKLYAENRQSLLIILQGMDSSGKDGTIKQIMNGVNQQGVRVHSFKHPSDTELEHDFLWRHIEKLPEHGEITIFNRSHYENVLISRVHPELVLAERRLGIDSIKKVNKKFWEERYEQINYFENAIINNGTQVLKFFLHLSYEEQRKRFLDRIENKERHWKFSSADITERGFWKQYQEAYEQALKNTSTKAAPWYIIPADDKPDAHLIIANVILDKMKKMNPTFPPTNKVEEELMKKAYKQLMDDTD